MMLSISSWFNPAPPVLPHHAKLQRPHNNKVNTDIRKSERIKSGWENRQYIQRNGLQICEYNRTMYHQNCAYTPVSVKCGPNSTNSSPYICRNIFDSSSNGPAHIRDSDLKYDYITSEQMKTRMVSPMIRIR
jgi:hypothetical protein